MRRFTSKIFSADFASAKNACVAAWAVGCRWLILPKLTALQARAKPAS